MAIVSASCNSASNGEQAADDSLQTEIETPAGNEMIGDHKRILGTYSGILPCADCEGIKTELVLKEDGSYNLTEQYLDTDKSTFTNEGQWTFNSKEKTVELSNIADGSNQYRVEDEALRMLDSGGNEVKGVLADKYVLKKK